MKFALMRSQSKVYLIPVPLADQAVHTLAPEIVQNTAILTHYFVENARTARRFLRLLHPDLALEPLNISEIDKNNGADQTLLINWLKEGHNFGIMSEAGCPGIADPGAEIVAVAHQYGATVIPLTGPSSILLALMASGLNGQGFYFHGYLPVKDQERAKSIKLLETRSAKEKHTQIFIETPYRNNKLLSDLLANCNNQTLICIAQNITDKDAFIRTMSVGAWKKQVPTLPKAPAIFLLQSQ